MDRRTVLASLLAAPAIARFAPGLAAAGVADPWKLAFDEALADNRKLLGWQGVSAKHLETPALAVSGRLPADLIGTLYRNGPAWNERSGRRYRHWFDGDGMVQAFRFNGSGVAHLGRTVETAKFRTEERAGRALWPAFGTPAPAPVALRGPDDLNPANISVLHHAGELLALWEGGSAHRLEPRTLETVGPKSWSSALKGVSFSAHPKVEPDGTLWNIGYAAELGLIVLYHIGADGSLRRAETIEVDPLGMVHDFVVTEHHLVIPLTPLVMDRERLEPSVPFLDTLVWQPDLGIRVLIVQKDDFTQRRWSQLPSGFFFHFGNAWEDSADTIRFDYCVAPDATVVTETFRQVMRGEIRPATGPTRLAQVVLGRDCAASQTVSELPAEFPRVAPDVVGQRYRQVYCVTGGLGMGDAPRGIVRFDLDSGTMDRFEYGERFWPEEHVFVPRLNARDETDGWVVGTALDLVEGVTRVSVFEASRLGDGPVAFASLPYPLPLGFHGIFVHSTI